MAFLKGLIDKFSSKQKELEESPEPEEQPLQVQVRIENLTGLVDIDRLMKYLREGQILFLKTKDLQKKDLGQFQTAVQKLKKVCTQNGWDLAGTEEGYLVVTPRFAQIVRS